MKNSILLICSLLLGWSGVAQKKIIEKNIDFKNRSIDLEVKFASEIDVKTWDKPTVYFKAELSADEAGFLDYYELNVEEENGEIRIASNALPMFEAYRAKYEAEHPDKKKYYCCDIQYEFNYTLYVPRNARFKVSSINGHLSSEQIVGDFTADLINGNIDIKEYAGELDLKTINGEIDLTMVNTSVTAETIHGNIYADEKLKFTSENRMVGQKIAGQVNNPLNRLRLSTINGNMYLRL